MSQPIGIQANVGAHLRNNWQTMGQCAWFLSLKSSIHLGPFSSFSVETFVSARVPSPPRVKRQDTSIENLTTGLRVDDIITETILTFPIIEDTTQELAVDLITTVRASAKKDGSCAYKLLKYAQELSHLHSQYNSCVLDV